MKLSTGASRLLSRLRWWLRRFGAIFPSQDKLATGLGVCKRTVQRWLDELREAGFVQVERRYRRSNLYTLTDARQMCFDFSTQEAEQVVLEPKYCDSECHNTVVPVVNPSTRKASRRELFTPSVIFVFKSNQARDAKPKPEHNPIPENLPFEVWRRIREKLRAAQRWIEKANNPDAYINAIVRRELAS